MRGPVISELDPCVRAIGEKITEHAFTASRVLAPAARVRHDGDITWLWERYLMRRSVLVCVLAGGTALTACTQFPELDQTATPGVATSPYPGLVPIETLLVGPTPRATDVVRQSIEARVAGLRTRADALHRARTGPGSDLARRLARLRQRAAALRNQ